MGAEEWFSAFSLLLISPNDTLPSRITRAVSSDKEALV